SVVDERAVVVEPDPARRAEQVPVDEAEPDRGHHRRDHEQEQRDQARREERRDDQPKAPAALPDHQSATAPASSRARTEWSDGCSSNAATNVARSTSAAAPRAHFASSHGSTSTVTSRSGAKTASSSARRNERAISGQASVPSPLIRTSSGLSTLTRVATARRSTPPAAAKIRAAARSA